MVCMGKREYLECNYCLLDMQSHLKNMIYWIICIHFIKHEKESIRSYQVMFYKFSIYKRTFHILYDYGMSFLFHYLALIRNRGLSFFKDCETKSSTFSFVNYSAVSCGFAR